MDCSPETYYRSDMDRIDHVYRVSSPRVIFENIEGELILVHMERGTYYSTDEIGAAIWSQIEARATAAEIGHALQARYDARPEEIAGAVASFLARLIDENLVATDPADEPRTPLPTIPEPKRPFAPPVLQSYRDMQDMLSLDPIHDVEASGWPVPKRDDEPGGDPEP